MKTKSFITAILSFIFALNTHADAIDSLESVLRDKPQIQE